MGFDTEIQAQKPGFGGGEESMSKTAVFDTAGKRVLAEVTGSKGFWATRIQETQKREGRDLKAPTFSLHSTAQREAFSGATPLQLLC